jgi:HEPN domain-containing protein
MKKTTRAWVRKAEDDHRLAETIARGSEPFHDQLCFHCQQSAEKYLKALLEELGLSVPKTHDLDEILTLLSSYYSLLRSQRRGLTFLSNFAVAARYPGFNVSKRRAASALRWAQRVRQTCRALLRIPPYQLRRKRP